MQKFGIILARKRIAHGEKVFKNMPTELCFCAPESLERSAKCRIRAGAIFAGTRIERKAALCGQSEAVVCRQF